MLRTRRSRRGLGLGVIVHRAMAEVLESRRLLAGVEWEQVAKLLASDGATGDAFGQAVALNGDIALVGSFFDDDNGVDAGSAYLFNVSTGQQIAKLMPADGAAGDNFGWSVAIDGSTALVGSPRDDDNGADSGSAYLFDINTGVQIAKLKPADGAAGDEFGLSVALVSSTAAIGSLRDDDNGTDSGSAYLFNVVTGEQIAKLKPLDGASGDEFGRSVALDNDAVLVGSRFDDDNGSNSGSAYVFDATTGSQIAKLKPSDGAASDNFGISVAISNNIALVGAQADDDNGADSGSAYLFNATTGSQIAKLKPTDGSAGDNFGRSVALSGNIALVDSFQDDDNGTDSGSAYLFNVITGTQIAKLRPGDGAAGDYFGFSVATSGNTALVGSINDDDSGTDSGSVYVFDWVVAWDGGGDGVNWTDPLNWSTDALPGPTDDVYIDIAGNPTIQITGTQTINSVTSSEHLQIANGTLAVSASSVTRSLTLGTTVPTGVVSGPTVNSANGHSYYLLAQDTWTANETKALQLGGHLATVNDATEQQWIAANLLSNGRVWIGLTDRVAEGDFRWSSGEGAAYRNWAPGEPTNFFPDEDYGVIEKNHPFIADGQWNNDRNVVVSSSVPVPFGLVEIETPTVSSVLTGSGDVTITGTLNWTGGTMSGAGKTIVAPTGELVLSGGAKQLSRLIQNDGNATWTGGDISFNGGSLKNNGTFTVDSAVALFGSGVGGVNSFDNAGTLTKQGLGTMHFILDSAPVRLNNSGSVIVQAGQLSLGGSGNHVGDFNVGAGTVLLFSGGTHSLSASSDITGAGSIRLVTSYATVPTVNHAGTVNIGGTAIFQEGTATFSGVSFAAGALTFTGGTANFNTAAPASIGTGTSSFSSGLLSGSGDVVFAGTLNWTGGTMSGSGKTIVGSGGTLDIGIGGVRTLNRNLKLDTGSTFEVDIAGPAAGTGFGQMAGTGNVELAGTLRPNLINAYDPGSGVSFPVIAGASRMGTFDTFAGTTTPGGRLLGDRYTATTALVTVRPLAGSPADLASSSDSGVSDSDDLTNVTTPTFTGTAGEGVTARIYADGVLVGSGPISNGTWSVTTSALADGVRSITATVVDADGDESPVAAPLSVTIDTQAPTLTLPGTQTAEATGPGGVTVNYPPATASDDVTATPTIGYGIASGAVFALGTTVVTVTATDEAGNVATDTFNVTVQDTTPSSLTVPGNLTIEATGPTGAIVNYGSASATDLVDPNVTITYSIASGSIFPLGTTVVTVTATDDFNNQTVDTFEVTVQDTTAPTLTLPTDVTVEIDSSLSLSAMVNYGSAGATDLVDPNVTITYSKASGTSFPLGETVVLVTARDAAGNESTGTFVVRVQDTIAPAAPAAVFGFETRQALELTFGEAILSSLNVGQLVVQNLTTSATFVPTVTVSGLTATLAFAGILPDGDYRLTVPTTAAQDPAGNALASATTLDFFVLAGDVNRDRSVGFSDLLTLAQNYNETGRTYSQGNLDYSLDGLVGFSDLLILAQNYSTSLIRTEPKPSVFGGRSIGRRGLFEADEAVIV